MKSRFFRILLALSLLNGFAFSQVIASADRFNTGNSTGLPLYPGAVASEHTDDRGTVSMTDSSQVRKLAAGAYLSNDKPEQVLQFYRERLKSMGQVVECTGGANTIVDVQLNDAAFENPSACNTEDFAASGTELKVVNNGEQKIVVVLPHRSGSEIALVNVKP